MKLYFVRHGKTQWNLEGRFQGANGDSPLLETSIEELHLLGKNMAHIKFDKIFSSDLPRAMATAQIINSENHFSQVIESHAELREWQLGSLEGQKVSTITAIYPHQMEAFRHNLAKFNNSIFGAESVYNTTRRTIDFIKSQKGQSYENLLFVGHGANLTASLRLLLGYDFAQLRQQGGLTNGSVTILETQDFEHFTLLDWNNVDHLEAIKTVSV
ncbi:phosphoglycerate mutase family protein [Streptococcus anginosus]|uniref:Histidine phosphatase family protein n=2 Tax=Streptococcus anginosus TaxID=1328 RepID=A0AAP6EMH7_STRAP|nr:MULTISPECIES: histidine phosphatase family protein [Streptococcus]AGU81950.1 phosphoglycerate mutase family protein [Streptococcus anginosus C1051]ALL03349.1 Phosphoglycerate mutase family 5 [Streptococcus anginosus]MCW1035610.1 histidine phosphatase family protein [Streptococcus anginosus]MDU6601183.1 histidine phosphatase family protein [Streptococcus anginosus]MDX5040115.1 histidine phosphatase family protein [Streptococcus anginosus]